MNENIGIWSCGRVSSKRCKNKMIRSFGNTTLTDIFLSKLKKLGNNTFFAGYESVFKEKCKKNNVRFVQRTEKSANVDEPASEIYNFLNDQNYKYLLQVNACLPFLRVETIINFLKICEKIKKPAFAVFEESNYFMNMDNKPLNFSKKISTINTKSVDKVKEFGHVFYFFEKEYFKKNGWYWDWDDVEYITIPKGIEMLDIDTEEDFKKAEIYWKGLNYK